MFEIIRSLDRLKKPAALATGVSVTSLLFYMVARADTRVDNIEKRVEDRLTRIECKIDAVIGIPCPMLEGRD